MATAPFDTIQLTVAVPRSRNFVGDALWLAGAVQHARGIRPGGSPAAYARVRRTDATGSHASLIRVYSVDDAGNAIDEGILGTDRFAAGGIKGTNIFFIIRGLDYYFLLEKATADPADIAFEVKVYT